MARRIDTDSVFVLLAKHTKRPQRRVQCDDAPGVPDGRHLSTHPMTTTIIAAAAAIGALALLLLLALAAGRRARGSADARLTAALAEVNARMEALAGELAGALERPRRRAGAAGCWASWAARSTSTRC